ncbi:MAG: UDP-2,3-diacylglucosamine diphosphatase [Gemmatimonadales bacterium]
MICQRAVLVGDAHLGRGSPETERAFLAFLETVPTLGDGLVVTGDLFEFWFSYRRAVPRRNLAVVAALATLRRKVPILLVGGNHDRWGGDFWGEDFGIEFEPLVGRFELNGRSAAVIHGDGITESHWSGRLLQRLTRNRVTIGLFHAIHPDVGFWLIDHLSGVLGDRERTETEIRTAAAHQAGWARNTLQEEPALGLLAMGHTHRPAVDGEPGKLYVNPGAWFDGYRYAIVSAAGAELCQFRFEGSASA